MALRLAGEEFRLPAWPLKSVFIKAKLQLLIRITKVDWPSSFARLRKATVMGSFIGLLLKLFYRIPL
jgi:hypothetical protein